MRSFIHKRYALNMNNQHLVSRAINCIGAFLAVLIIVGASVSPASGQSGFRRCTVCSPGCPCACNFRRDADPSAPAPQPPALAPGEQAYDKGKLLFDRDEFTDALPWLETAAREDPDNSRYAALLAECRKVIRQLEDKKKKEAEQEEMRKILERRTAKTVEEGLSEQQERVTRNLPSIGPGQQTSIPIVRRSLDGARPLPAPTWDCYCEYRYVTRPNG